jgi:hypothetical protein
MSPIWRRVGANHYTTRVGFYLTGGSCGIERSGTRCLAMVQFSQRNEELCKNLHENMINSHSILHLCSFRSFKYTNKKQQQNLENKTTKKYFG